MREGVGGAGRGEVSFAGRVGRSLFREWSSAGLPPWEVRGGAFSGEGAGLPPWGGVRRSSIRWRGGASFLGGAQQGFLIGRGRDFLHGAGKGGASSVRGAGLCQPLWLLPLRMTRCVPPSQQPAWRQRGHQTEEAEPRRVGTALLTPRPGTGWRGRLVRSPGPVPLARLRVHLLGGAPQRSSRLTLALLGPRLTRVLGSHVEGLYPESRLGLGLTGEAGSCLLSPSFLGLPDGVPGTICRFVLPQSSSRP